MEIQKINWKLYLKNPGKVDPDAWFRGFAQWIENSPEVFVDVADYKHVSDGPLMVLVGYACDYWLDANYNRQGLLYNQRQNLAGSNTERIKSSLKSLLDTAERINNDQEFGESVFSGDELLFLINDRMAAPNLPETFEQVSAELKEALGDDIEIEHNDNKRERFSVNIKLDGVNDLGALRKKVGV